MGTPAVDIGRPRHVAVPDDPPFLDELRTIAGRRYVLTNPGGTRHSRTDIR
ncbi:MAG: hypothetical protein QOK29_2467 [Rhodospirillaceae bacterium]|jgi:hypothetical protein|nr:hypothetical protein [Rhodospirillaceae bacterium]